MHTWEQLPPEHLPRTLADREAQPLLRFLQMPTPGLLGTVKGGSRQAHGKSEGHESERLHRADCQKRGCPSRWKKDQANVVCSSLSKHSPGALF